MSRDKCAEYINSVNEAKLEPIVQVLMENYEGQPQYFFDNSLTATAIIYGQTVVYCHPKFISNLKGIATTYINGNYEEFVHPEDVHKVKQFLDSFYQSGVQDNILRFRMLDWQGNPVWIEITGQPIIYHEKNSILVMATSLTNNMRKIQFIKDFADIYRNFAEKSPDGIVIRKGNRILYANTRAIERSGFPLEKIKQLDAFVAIAPDDINVARELTAKWDSGQDTPKLVELRILDAAGEVFTCEVASSFISYHGEPAVQHTFRDISYRKIIQNELQFQSNLLSNVNDCIIVTDANYHIIFWNLGAERLLGWKNEEVIGKKLGSVLRKDSFIDNIKNNLTTNGNWEGQIDTKTMQDDCKSIKLSVSTITDDWGNTSVVVIASDITELLASQSREREANQAKSDFLAHLSHELRTPLVGIVGYCELLNSDSEGPNNKESLATMEYCARQLLDLANNMLDLSKIEARQVEIMMREIDLHNLINYTVNSFYPNTKTDVQLSVDISPLVPRTVMGDDAKIKQIITNLLANAFKFTNQGYIKVKVELDRSFALSKGIYAIKIKVIDSGIGVKENDRTRIFEPFVHDVAYLNAQGGTGLGLAICKQLVELMGGSIWCDANSEGGAEFGFILPLQEVTSGRAESCTSINSITYFDGLKVLLAEDISVNRKLITLMLEKLGCEVVAVNNGEECIQTLDKYKPDIILMDMQMPVLDGYSATQIIKRKPFFATIPIIALTAYAMTDDIKKCQKAGCDHYLSKPFTGEQLANVLEKCVLIKNN